METWNFKFNTIEYMGRTIKRIKDGSIIVEGYKESFNTIEEAISFIENCSNCYYLNCPFKWEMGNKCCNYRPIIPDVREVFDLKDLKGMSVENFTELLFKR